ncbi:CAP domain-containing protein [Pontixanthobacter sp.]|uniref:CAP domain-containing protein n=1 Tax=Pontixanthobacter sp. TaxID=2792078 RepID=UPI003C7E6057
MQRLANLTVCSLIIGAAVLHGIATASDTAAPEGPSDMFESTLLDQHNAERLAKDLPVLFWDTALEIQAREWAVRLANDGAIHHSAYEARNTAGENIWAGSAGQFKAEDMMRTFLEERRYFHAGKFPYVTTTGRWQDVGHYTQIIWASTQRVGCAIETGDTLDFLVCRYWPSGNMAGVYVG